MGNIIVRLPDDLHDDFKAVLNYKHESIQERLLSIIQDEVERNRRLIRPRWKRPSS